MKKHRDAVNPPPPPEGVSPVASTLLPPSFDDDERDTLEDLEQLEAELMASLHDPGRPTERTPVPPEEGRHPSQIRTLLSPPPTDEKCSDAATDEGCRWPRGVASSSHQPHDQQVRLARKS